MTQATHNKKSHSRRKKCLRVTLLAATLLCTSGAFGNSNPFIEAMRTMINMMSSMSGGNNNSSQPWNLTPYQQAWMAPQFSNMSAMPLQTMQMQTGNMAANQMLSQPYQQATGFTSQNLPIKNQPATSPGTSSSSDGLTPLEGNWEGQGGVKLLVHGDRFTLAKESQSTPVQGLIQTHQQYVAMRPRDSQMIQYYEFAISDGRMVLRDTFGNLLLFRHE